MATKLTVNVPDELANRLESLDDQLPEILELGLKQWDANQHGDFNGLVDVLESLANLPAPEEVLALRPSAEFQERIRQLLAKNRNDGLSPDEEREWRQYEFVEHLVRIAKAKAMLKLKQHGSTDESNVHSN